MVTPTVWARIRAEIDRSGWRQYGGVDLMYIPDDEWNDGPCCILQAAGRLDDLTDIEWGRAQDRFCRHTCAETLGIWNDAPGRTLADVHAVLDALDAEDRAA